MVVIVGESASGKSTLQRKLTESNNKFEKLITYTTRPKRHGEEDGVDYHFISADRFEKMTRKGLFADCSTYRGWSYGVAKEDCINSKYKVAVLTPSGVRRLIRQGVDVTSVYLYVDRRARMLMSILRGDDIDEAYRRNLSDVGQFDGITEEVDYVIDNSHFHMNENQVLKCLENIVIANGN